jgi:hypothetical protein
MDEDVEQFHKDEHNETVGGKWYCKGWLTLGVNYCDLHNKSWPLALIKFECKWSFYRSLSVEVWLAVQEQRDMESSD